MVWAFPDIAFPDMNDLVSASGHICILRDIKAYTLGLPLVWVWELLRMSMPVITINLNNQRMRRNECVNTELIIKEVLGLIRYTNDVQDNIHGAFEVIGTHGLLLGIHPTQQDGTVGVIVATSKRTIDDRVFVVLGPRWRPLKGFAAHLASMSRLIACLPFVSMAWATEPELTQLKSTLWQVECCSAKAACYFPSCPLAWMGRSTIALMRTIFLGWTESLCNRLATTFTGYGSDSIGIHGLIVASQGDTVKPMRAMRYA